MIQPHNTFSLTFTAVFTADFLSTHYAANKKYLEARWSRPVSSEEFREGMKAIIDSISTYGIELLLIDFRLMATPSVSDQNWLVNYMRVANQNTTLRRSARIFSKDVVQQIVSEIITEKVETFPYDYQVFDNESLAKQWLFQQESRL